MAAGTISAISSASASSASAPAARGGGDEPLGRHRPHRRHHRLGRLSRHAPCEEAVMLARPWSLRSWMLVALLVVPYVALKEWFGFEYPLWVKWICLAALG